MLIIAVQKLLQKILLVLLIPPRFPYYRIRPDFMLVKLQKESDLGVQRKLFGTKPTRAYVPKQPEKKKNLTPGLMKHRSCPI